MSDALRELALRFRYCGAFGDDADFRDLRRMSELVLAANPPDGEQLADPDWLNGLSREGGDGTLSMFTIRVVGREIRLVIGDYVAEKPLTRNAMRKLAEAFNIVLREEPANDVS